MSCFTSSCSEGERYFVLVTGMIPFPEDEYAMIPVSSIGSESSALQARTMSTVSIFFPAMN